MENNIQRRVLVTGGLGYLGSHLVVDLLTNDFSVDVIDNLYNSNVSTVDKIKQITGKDFRFFNVDITNKDDLEKIFNQTNYSAIFHLAAVKSVGESVLNPIKYYNVNVSGSLNLIDLSIKYKLQHFIFSSTSCVYGDTNEVVKETSPLNPVNPYGRSKLYIEQVLEDCSKANQINSIVLRYANIVGAHSSGIIGESPTCEFPANLFAVIGNYLKGKLQKLKVFGNDYNTRDGTAIRDYIHVQDVVDAHLMALEYLEKNSDVKYDVFNLGTSTGSTVLEVIETYSKECGRNIEYEISERRKGDVECSIFNYEKIQSKLNWNPRKSLQISCLDDFNFIKQNNKL